MTDRPHVCFDGVMDAARSGGWRVLTSTLRALAQTDAVRLTVIIPRDRAEELSAVRGLSLVTVTARPEQPFAAIAWRATRLPELVKRLGADVLHVPSHQLLIMRRVCPTVLTIHDLTEFHLAHHYDPLRTFYRRIVVPRNARLADRVATVSEWVGRDIAATLAVPRERIVVAANGVDARFHPISEADAAERVRAACGLEQPYVLYVGQIHMPNKNLVRLVEAFAAARPRLRSGTALVLAGREVTGGDEVREAIRRARVEEAVRWIGYVPDDLLPALYGAADVFCYPSLQEGFGLPVLEAMACGTPVVTSATTALLEVARDAALLVDPLDVEELSAALATGATDAGTRVRLRRAGTARAAQYSWEATAGILAREYFALARERRAGASL